MEYPIFFSLFPSYLKATKLDNFNLQGTYEVHIGKFTESVKEVITPQIYQQRYLSNNLQAQEIFNQVIKDFKGYVHRNPRIMSKYIVNTDLMDTTSYPPNYKRQNRIYTILTKYQTEHQLNVEQNRYNTEDVSIWTTEVTLLSNCIVSFHPCLFRIYNRRNGHIMFRVRKDKKESTGIDELKWFMSELVKNRYATPREERVLVEMVSKALNLRFKNL